MPSLFHSNNIILAQTISALWRNLSVYTYQVFWALGSGLILLKMIAEYMDISNALPALATEIVHRVAEILKSFNSRSCQLVLGAGAMQVRCRLLEKAVQFIWTLFIFIIWWSFTLQRWEQGAEFLFSLKNWHRWYLDFCLILLHLTCNFCVGFRQCNLLISLGFNESQIGQVAGLKSITAKHLALASQSISFFYALIPGTNSYNLLMFL